ncbi:MAG: DUF2849 domain-containing protein [Alphaproteobacteria bacterium GM202ARS2]|nr:DUF2849 domain-containing protein [Alphaproteobacteria bacterium GM202ARS2]
MQQRVITASRLQDGCVVYWRDGAWVLFIDEATRFTDVKKCEGALQQAEEAVGRQEVVSPYWIEVVPIGDDEFNGGLASHRVTSKWVPVRYREVIRAFGPSVHLHFGKQALLRKEDT